MEAGKDLYEKKKMPEGLLGIYLTNKGRAFQDKERPPEKTNSISCRFLYLCFAESGAMYHEEEIYLVERKYHGTTLLASVSLLIGKHPHQ